LKFKKNDDSIMLSLKNLIESLYYSNEQSVSLIEFKNNFSKEYKKFEGKKDNDSTFFLIYLFQYLQKVFLKQKRKVTKLSKFAFLKLKTEEKKELKKFLESYEPKNYSSLHDLVYGYQMSEIICSNCNKEDISFQAFNILHLSLYDGMTKLTSLEQSINSFLYTKDKKGSENFVCSKCQKSCLSHVISIIKLPPILIINLKRVGERNVYYHDISIPFVLKTKNIEKLEKFKNEYELIGYIKHFGNANDGHNVAYSKNIFDNKWYCFNDAQVEEIKGYNSTKGSFLLFYQLNKNINE
jgi:ubiquitin C-terminal hydrolase